MQTKEERKESNKKHQYEYWSKNKDRYREYRREQTARTRLWFRELKKTLKCSKCGENHPACIQFHHTVPDEKEFNIADMVRSGYGTARIEGEIKKCIVLCANCHSKEHYTED